MKIGTRIKNIFNNYSTQKLRFNLTKVFHYRDNLTGIIFQVSMSAFDAVRVDFKPICGVINLVESQTDPVSRVIGLLVLQTYLVTKSRLNCGYALRVLYGNVM